MDFNSIKGDKEKAENDFGFYFGEEVKPLLKAVENFKMVFKFNSFVGSTFVGNVTYRDRKFKFIFMSDRNNINIVINTKIFHDFKKAFVYIVNGK